MGGVPGAQGGPADRQDPDHHPHRGGIADAEATRRGTWLRGVSAEAVLSGRSRADRAAGTRRRLTSRSPSRPAAARVHLGFMNVGIIGWRGMVGSVLVQRMREERDFAHIDPVFFSTSQAGAAAPEIGKRVPAVKDARDIAALSANDVLISCQGGDYTSEIYPRLRQAGWDGYWIDAASTLRMAPDSMLILDPVNGDVIERAVTSGVRNYVGGNCTVSLMLMA